MRVVRSLPLCNVVGMALVLLAVIALLPNPAFSTDLYEGKAIQLIVPYPAGGDNDTISRLVARRLGEHIPGKPSIIVQNMPGAGGIVALNYVYNVSKPDGLTIVSLASAAVRHQLVGVATVKFDFGSFEHLGNVGPLLQVFVVDARLPYKSIVDLKPVKTPVTIAGGAAGSTSSVIARILAREGYNVRLTTGYPGAADRIMALQRREADASTIGWIQLYQDKESFRPLLWAGAKGPEWTHLPSIEELDLSPSTRSFIRAFTVPMNAGRSFAMPPRTPRKQVEIVQRALEKTVKDPIFLADAAKLQVDVDWVPGEQTRQMFLQVLKTPRASINDMKETLGIAEK